MSLYQKLKEFKPRGNLSLHDAVAQVKSNLKNGDENKNKLMEIVPASQLLTKNDTHRSKQVLNKVAKNKRCPRKISSLNVDSLSQQCIESYFKKVESGCSEVDSGKSTEESTLTDYKESDGSSNISSSESSSRQSLRNIPFMAEDVDGSDSTQEFDCEEYNEEEILNSDDEIEFSQQEHNETLEGEIVDNEMGIICQSLSQDNEYLYRTVVKTEVCMNIEHKNNGDMCLVKKEMTADLSRVKIENSCMTSREGYNQPLYTESCNFRVKQEKQISHVVAAVKTNHGKKTMTENCKQTEKKRKQSQSLLGDKSDDEMCLELVPGDQRGSKHNNLSLSVSLKPERDSSLTHDKVQTNKMDKLSFPLKNTSNNYNIKEVCEVQEVTFTPVNKSSKYHNVQNTSEHLKDKQDDMQSNDNDTAKVSRQIVADTVVKHLMPFYKEKRIASRDLFKLLARQLAHHLLEHCRTGKFSFLATFLLSHQNIFMVQSLLPF